MLAIPWACTTSVNQEWATKPMPCSPHLPWAPIAWPTTRTSSRISPSPPGWTSTTPASRNSKMYGSTLPYLFICTYGLFLELYLQCIQSWNRWTTTCAPAPPPRAWPEPTARTLPVPTSTRWRRPPWTTTWSTLACQSVARLSPYKRRKENVSFFTSANIHTPVAITYHSKRVESRSF